MRLFGYSPTRGAAAGDTMPFYHDGHWHLFFSQPPVDAWEYVERARVSTAYLKSKDLVNWEVMPDAFGPGEHGECDGDGIWTGSVIEHQGTYHFFYTGYNRESSSPQSICKTTSTDLANWTKSDQNPLILPDNRWYETVDWRDPFVYRDEEADCFKMLISARLKSGPQFRRGCIAVATSKDLEKWEVGPPLASSMLTHCPECPEIFQLGDWWYLVESRYSERMQTVYRVSRSPNGPWESRKLDSLDGRRFYAAKSASDGERRFSFAWIPFRKFHEADNNWVWGGELGSPRELKSLEDGTLICQLPKEISSIYKNSIPHTLNPIHGKWNTQDSYQCEAYGEYGFALFDISEDEEMLLDITIEPSDNTEAVGVLIEPKGEQDLDRGYQLSIEPMKQRVIFDRWPASMDPLWDSLVLNERHKIKVYQEIDNPLIERPLAFVPKDNKYHIQILRKGSAIECFVADQVVASYRIYDNSPTHKWGLFVQEGKATFHQVGFRK